MRARLTHVGPIASRMREIDRMECEAIGRTPRQALRDGLVCSLNPLTVMVNDRPEVMLGVVPQSLMEGRGIVWLLGTDEVYKYPKEWALLGPRLLAAMAADCPCLENIVSVGNHRSIAFLRHLGFTVGGGPVRHGGMDFLGFRYAIQDEPAHA